MKLKRILPIIILFTLLLATISCSKDKNGLTYLDAATIGEHDYNYSFGDKEKPSYWCNSYDIKDDKFILYDVWNYNPHGYWEKNDILVYPGNISVTINRTNKSIQMEGKN